MAHQHEHHDGDDHGHARHDHDHGGSGHVHAPASFGKAFAIGMGLNAAFVVLEAVFGIASNSVALLADAGHNLSDTLGLGVAWAAVILAKRQPTARFTYGLGGTSILAALFNAVFLLVVVGGLSWEAIQRFSAPEPVAGRTVMIVAGCGIVLNGVCAWLFASGSKNDLNVRGAFMHMAADALVSLGVVVAGFIILLTGWHWIDPAMSLIINAVIIWGTWGLLTGSVSMSLNAVPPGIETATVEAYLKGLPGVAEVHDLHIWPMSTTETALTVHLVRPSGLDDDLLVSAAHELEHRFKIQHATIQMEIGTRDCKLAPASVV
ncbi:MAG TPA: cation transporter [Acetobacteraceae bacterium]|jgi:cobalt-zinc-cadmium efflux system protein|nr:cation transporter [Acetobacteraceae bacterium]